jgi:aminoglycoside phosphotransferase (APT) family kinase protein
MSAGAGTDSERTGLDVAALSGWLAERTELRAPVSFTRIGNGQSNLTYRAEDAHGHRAVLRRPPLGAVLESAHDMAREHRIIAGLNAAGAPVPRTLGLCEDLAVTGAPFYVMELIPGPVIFSEADAQALDEPTRRTAGLEMARTLARLQAVDLAGAGLGDLVRNTPYVARQLRRWLGQWEASRTRELALVPELAERFAAAMPSEAQRVLIHGDYRLDNLILGPDGHIGAVLDWELASAGHPLADLGLTIAYWNEAGLRDGLFRQAVTSLPGFPTVDELIAAYAEAAGCELSPRDVSAWVAFGYWRIAIIIEGVHRRWLANPVNGAESAGGVGAAVPRLIALADAAAREAQI